MFQPNAVGYWATVQRVALVAVVSLGVGAARDATAARLPGEYYNEYHFNYITPHTPWAKPYAKGKLRVFVIAPTHAAREVTELAQRLDCIIGGETAIASYALGSTGRYVAMIRGTSPTEKKQAILRKLRDPYDVYVLANFPITKLPIEVQFEILKRVKFGAGLVLTFRNKSYPQMWRHPLPDAQPMVHEVPLAGLSFYRTTFLANAESLSQRVPRLVSGFRIGKGRVAQLDYATASKVGIAGGWCLTPAELFTYRTVTEYDYHQSLVAKAVLWAAKREPAVRFTSLPLEGFKLSSDASSNRIAISATNTASSAIAAAFEVSVRNEWGEHEFAQPRKVSLAPGANALTLDLPQLAGGTHFLDLRVASSRGVEGWASAALLVDSPVKLDKVEPSKLTFDRAEPCTGTVALDKPCPAGDWRVRVALLDNYDRWFAQGEFPLEPGDKAAAFSLPLTHSVSLANRVRAVLLRGQQPMHAAEGEFFVRQPEGDDFPALVWGNYPGIFGHYAARQLQRFGFNAILHYYGDGLRGESRRPVDIARQDMRAIPYAARIAWKDGRVSNRWRDARFANSPAERAKLSAPYDPLVYSLGDENYIPDDGGTHPDQRPAFAKFLAGRYPSVKELNAAWRATYASFDQAECLSRIAARSNPPRYHDCEAFRERLYAAWHHEWHDAIKKVDPRARVGAEGSVPGELELTIKGLEFWGPYRRPEQIALQSAISPRSIIRGSWFGGYNYGRHDPTYTPRFLWSTVLDGSTLLEVYCSYTCEDFYNSDLSFAYWMDWFLPDLMEITDGLGQMLAHSEHRFDRVALYHSQSSLHMNACVAPFGRYDKAHRGALAMLSDLSFVPGYVTSRQVEAGALAKNAPALLVMPHAVALSDKEAKAIEAYVRAGGIVLADVAPGVADERCVMRKAGALDALFGIHSNGAKTKAKTTTLALGQRVELKSVRADAAVTLAGAQPLLTPSADARVVVANSVGKGRAVLLNFSWSQYSTQQDERGRRPWVALAQALMAKLQVAPAWRLADAQGKPLPGVRVSTFQRGPVTYVGVLAPRLPDTNAAVAATLCAPKPLHMFDLRAGEHLGRAQQVALPLDQTSATFISAMPFRPTRVRVDARWDARQHGLLVKCELQGDGLPQDFSPVFRVNVFGPDGQPRRYYARTLYPSTPRADALIPLALDDAPGEWRVEVRDVDTGLNATATATVAKR